MSHGAENTASTWNAIIALAATRAHDPHGQGDGLRGAFGLGVGAGAAAFLSLGTGSGRVGSGLLMMNQGEVQRRPGRRATEKRRSKRKTPTSVNAEVGAKLRQERITARKLS